MAEVTDYESTPAPTVSGPPEKEEGLARRQARERVERKLRLRADLVAYAVINVALIVVWAVTGFGYFWPAWVLAGWGVLLLLEFWNLHFQRPVTDEDIDRELRSRQ